MAEILTCFDCGLKIHGPTAWLGSDLTAEGGGRIVYSFHPDCSLGAWPLSEMTEEEAMDWILDGAFTNVPPAGAGASDAQTDKT